MGYTKNETPVMRDSRKLCYYTLRVTQNLNNFPKKYRYTLVDRLISSALDIHDNISDANLSWGSERIAYQTEAIKSCRKVRNGELELAKLQKSYGSWRNHAELCTDKTLFGYYEKRLKQLKEELRK